MPEVTIASAELYSAKRSQKIRSLLKPLVSDKKTPICEPFSARSQYIIGTHDGMKNGQYREWRFRTYVNDFLAMYFEIWNPSDAKGQNFHLDRAYLSLFKVDRQLHTEEEYLALHCDPVEPDDEIHALYKRGPHLHISAARHPIPRAHIALNRWELNHVLGSIETLSDAVGLAILMLKEQFLRPYE